MLKDKYLHRHGRQIKRFKPKNLNHTKNTRDGSEFPFRESIRDSHKNGPGSFYKDCNIDFTPCICYMKENINRDWDDVYSEIIKKVSPRYRYLLDNELKYFIEKIIFIDHVPYIKGYRSMRVAVESFYIDEKGFLRFYDTLDDIYTEAKRLIRKDKIRKLEENIKQESIENQEPLSF